MSKENPELTRIHFRLTKEEVELVDRNAKLYNRERNLYIKEMALHGTVINFDYKYFNKNNCYMKEVKNDIRLLIYTILQTNEYFSIDLENINNSLQKIIENQGEILREIRKENRNLKRILKENVQEIKAEEKENDNQECF